MKINYIVLLPVIILFFCNHIFAQNNTDTSCDEIIKDNRHGNSTYDYISKKRIELKPGFSYNANGNNTFNALADPYMICEISNENIVEDEYNQQNPYRHDKTLTVGSIAGQAGVSETGAATYQIPLFISPGTAGMEPSVSIVYNSQSGNGVLGMGWHLSGLSSVSLAPNVYYLDGYSESVKFDNQGQPLDNYRPRFALDGTRLACVNGTYATQGSEYRTEIESFSRINYENDKFIVHSKNGMKSFYGSNNNSKLKLPTLSYPVTFSWNIDRVEDPNGNYITYDYYENTDGEKLIKKISYTGNQNAGIVPYNSVEFIYSERTDKASSYVSGTKFKQTVVLTKIIIKHRNQTVKEYSFKYHVDRITRLIEIIESDNQKNKLNSTVIEWGKKGTTTYGIVDSENITAPCEGCNIPGINYDFMAGDFNGDGIHDFAYVYNSQYSFGGGNDDFNKYFKIQAYLGNIDGTFTKSTSTNSRQDNHNVYIGDFDYDGVNELLLVNTYNSQTYKFKWNGSGFSSTLFTAPISNKVDRFLIPGNFYGNGKPSNIDLFKNKSGTSYQNYMKLNSFDDNNQHRGFNIANYETGLKTFYNSIDFDGDGVSELLEYSSLQDVLKISEYKPDSRDSLKTIYTFPPEIISEPYKFGLFPKKYKFADINGDGKTDLFFENMQDNNWNIYFSTGTGFEHQGSFQTSDISNQIYVIDMDGDGKADIVEARNGVPSYIYIHRSNGDGTFTTILEKHLNINIGGSMGFGDFNADGYTDIIYGHSSSNIINVMYFNKDSRNYLVERITDGFNVKNEFTYKNLTIQNKELGINLNSSDITGELYPLNSGLVVVSEFRQSNAVGGMNKINYEYRNGKVHVSGKGFMGFGEVASSSRDLNISSKTINRINTRYYVGDKSISETYSFDGSLISRQVQEMLLRETSPGSIAVLPKVAEVSDKLTSAGNITRNVYTYENEVSGTFLGNITRTETDYSGVYSTITEITGYSSNGSWCGYKPLELIETRIQGGSFKTRTNFTYDQKGNLRSRTRDSFNTGGKPLTEDYYYDACGNITTSITIGDADCENDIQLRQTEYEYDNLKRFVTKTTDMLGMSEKSTYNPLFGVVLTSTDTRGDITTYEYDNFGNLKKIYLPLGHITTIETKWENNMQDKLAYYIKTTSPGQPETTTWYDILGRDVMSEASFYGNVLVTGKEYRTDGLVLKEKLPHFRGSANINYAQYSYDKFKRLTSSTSLGLTTTYSYNNAETTTSYPDGINETKKTNAAGQLIEVESTNGNILYSYNANGSPSVITAGGVQTRMEYDAYGNQAALIDVNAGTTKYNYNAFGELRTQQDANNNIFELYYDDAGRLESKHCTNDPAFSVNYSYYSSGKQKGLLRREQMGNNTYKEYEYDNYGKLVLLTEFINGETFTHRYTYDEFDNIITYTYPSGYMIKNIYDSHGFLIGVTEEDDTPIWQLSGSESVNEMGQFLNYRLGFEYIDVSFKYDSHYQLQEHRVGSVFNYKYEFDNRSGNLLSREDVRFGLKETFEYDNLNRLTEWKTFGARSGKIVNYHQNGNISFKSNVGEYQYDNDKVHALTKVENTVGTTMISSLDQSVKYNPLQKTSEITEGTNNYKYEILYGADSERKITKFYTSDVLKKTRYYSGLYEREIDERGNIRELNFIPTGDGILAVSSINTYARVAGNLTFLIKDHLGSLILPISPYEEEHQLVSYDPWGNLRDPYTWEYSEGIPRMSFLNRGYTFHEMLPEFGLINMNGRMYDPVLGRILSPDNYVQSPLNAQNYNRYSYCLNNPLKYTDPTGDFVLGAVIVGAAIGAYLGGAASEGWEMNPTNWSWNGNTLAGMGLGAVLGGAAGLGFYYTAPAIAKTGFFSHFGASGTIASYTLSGSVLLGVTGYGAGFSGGMLYSRGDLVYSHQSGIYGSELGSIIGGLTGFISGNIAEYKPNKSPKRITVPDRPKWDGPYFQGTEEEAKEILLTSSKLYNVETSYWSTSRGYYFEPIQGTALSYEWDKVGHNEIIKYNYEAGYSRNTISTASRYTHAYKKDGELYIYPKNIFSNSALVYYKAHTHPGSSPPSMDDRYQSNWLGVPGKIVGWNGKIYKYFKWDY